MQPLKISTNSLLASAVVADFFGNELTGSMPEAVCDLRQPPFGTGALFRLSSDCNPDPNNGDEIAVLCECCSDCFPTA